MIFLKFFILLTMLNNYSWAWTLNLAPELTAGPLALETAARLDQECPRSTKLEVTIASDAIIFYLKGEVARMNNPQWIEVNPYLWANLTPYQKRNLLLHEIGHTLGLDHSENPTQVMGVGNLTKEVNVTHYWELIRLQCKKMSKDGPV